MYTSELGMYITSKALIKSKHCLPVCAVLLQVVAALPAVLLPRGCLVVGADVDPPDAQQTGPASQPARSLSDQSDNAQPDQWDTTQSASQTDRC